MWTGGLTSPSSPPSSLPLASSPPPRPAAPSTSSTSSSSSSSSSSCCSCLRFLTSSNAFSSLTSSSSSGRWCAGNTPLFRFASRPFFFCSNARFLWRASICDLSWPDWRKLRVCLRFEVVLAMLTETMRLLECVAQEPVKYDVRAYEESCCWSSKRFQVGSARPGNWSWLVVRLFKVCLRIKLSRATNHGVRCACRARCSKISSSNFFPRGSQNLGGGGAERARESYALQPHPRLRAQGVALRLAARAQMRRLVELVNVRVLPTSRRSDRVSGEERETACSRSVCSLRELASDWP